MEIDNPISEVGEAPSYLAEDAIEPTSTSVTHPARRTTPTAPCTHSRAIDDVLSRSKKRTGKVRCLECGAVFDDPYQGLK